MKKFKSEDGKWFVNTYPTPILRTKLGKPQFIFPANNEEHADKLLKIAQSILNGDFS
jgi:hypothetical protein